MSLNWLKSLIKNHPAQTAAYLGLLALTTTQFTNCGGYSAMDSASSSSFECTTADCIAPNADNLKISPVIVSSNGTYPVHGLFAFNLGGNCNEGGYATNVIKWELFQNGNRIRNSDDPVTKTSDTTWGTGNTKCDRGHFSLYVNLGAYPNGPSLAPLTGSGYSMRVSIYGIAAGSGQLVSTPISSSVVTLSN